MSWQLFRWIWRLDSPLFVGTSPAGALNRCRLYVPARTIWGALTAELTRLEARDDQQYRQVGEELREYARFSYLYPAELVGEEWLAWLPEYRKGDGLLWVRERDHTALGDRRFRRRLLWTRPATAIDPNSDSALEGSLRETECVQPHWRCDDNSPGSSVAMVGYVFLWDGKDLPKRLAALNTLFVGGDTRYGLGRLEREGEMKPEATLFGTTVELDQQVLRVLSDRLLAHGQRSGALQICGDLEAIAGWDMAGDQQVRPISGPVWTPGSRIVNPGETPRFRIDEDGLWRIDGQSTASAPPKGAASS